MVTNLKQPTLSAFKIREIVLFGLFAAMMIISKEILAFLPNIEIVTLLVIVFTLSYGLRTLIPVYIFVLAEGLLYGFGFWFWSYTYIWTILVFLVYLLRKNENLFVFTALSGIYGLLFGILGSIPNFVVGGIGGGIAYIIAGIPFDIAHCLGNVVTTLALFLPLRKLLKKLA